MYTWGILSMLLTCVLLISACDTPSTETKDPLEPPPLGYLRLYAPPGAVLESALDTFNAQGAKLTIATYAHKVDFLSKIDDSTGYDLAILDDNAVKAFSEKGLLKQFQASNISNLRNLDVRFKELPFDPDGIYSIPYQWGTMGLMVDTIQIKDAEASWELMFNPTYAGKVAVLDNPRLGLVPALKKLGYSLNTTTASEVDEAMALMKAQKGWRFYKEEEIGKVMEDKENWIVYGLNADMMPYQKGKYEYLLPKEGTHIWVNNMCILNTCKNDSLAHAFIAYMLSPKVAAELANTRGLPVPNKKAFTHIYPEYIRDKSRFPDETTLVRCEFIQGVGEKKEMYEKAWEEAKGK